MINPSIHSHGSKFTDASPLYLDDANDRVGINIAVPASTLHVESTSTSGLRAYNGSQYVSLGANTNAGFINVGGSPGHGLRIGGGGGNGSLGIFASHGVALGAFGVADPGAYNLTVQAPAGSPGLLTLSTAELTIEDGNELGRINFSAPLHTVTGDSRLVSAAIWAEADDDFSETVNTTSLVFATATSETAAEKMRLDSAGTLTIKSTGSGWTKLFEIQSNGTTCLQSTANALEVYHAGVRSHYFAWDGHSVRSDAFRGWSDTTTAPLGGGDVRLYRDAAGILAQRNGTNGQTFKVYGTWTDASNYTRLSLSDGGTGSITIAAETAGTGTDNVNINLTPAGTGDVIIKAAGGNLPSLFFGDGDTGFVEAADDDLRVYVLGSNRYQFSSTAFRTVSAGCELNNNPTLTNPSFKPNWVDADTGIGQDGVDTLSLITGGASRMLINSAGVTVGGGMTYTGIQAVTGSADLATTAYYCPVSTGGGAFTLTIPTAQHIVGRKIIIKDIDGYANTSNITIATESSQTIDGNATAVISTAKGYRELICTSATTWHIIASDA